MRDLLIDKKLQLGRTYFASLGGYFCSSFGAKHENKDYNFPILHNVLHIF